MYVTGVDLHDSEEEEEEEEGGGEVYSQLFDGRFIAVNLFSPPSSLSLSLSLSLSPSLSPFLFFILFLQ